MNNISIVDYMLYSSSLIQRRTYVKEIKKENKEKYYKNTVSVVA